MGRRSFTLPELLVVVVVLAVLASMAIPEYIKAVEKSRAAEALDALGAIRQSVKRYRWANSTGIYPDNAADLDIGATNLKYWDSLNLDNNSDGTGASAKGYADYQRNGGNFDNRHLGITFGTGILCGDFVPMGLILTAGKTWQDDPNVGCVTKRN